MSSSFAIAEGFSLGASAVSLVSWFKNQIAIRRGQNSTEASVTEDPCEDSIAHHKLKGVIVSGDSEIVAIFSQLLREIGLDVHKTDEEFQAVSLLTSNKFEVLVVDFDNFAYRGMLKTLRTLRPHQDIVVFAVVSDNESKTAAQNSGNVLLVDQPLMPSQIRGHLRAIYGHIIRSSQAYFRVNVEVPVSVERAATQLRCHTTNLSQDGMGIVTPIPFYPGEQLNLVFAIPDTGTVMNIRGIVIWSDGHTRAGIRFEAAGLSLHRRYYEWLQDHFFMQLQSQTHSSAQTVHSH